MSADFRLDGRVALVTGASAGLGVHFAAVLAEAGARAVLAARRLDRVEARAASLVARGLAAEGRAIDVTDQRSVEAAVGAIAAELGGIDVLVNNAGVAVTKPFLDLSAAEWQSVIDTNLTGMMRVGQAVARDMAARGRGGAIVNIASILGLRSATRLAPYAAAKAAVISLTQTMAVELARHAIRVNALAPGYVETDLNRGFLLSPAGEALARRVPMRRFGRLADLDGPLLLLASDAGGFITGATLPVDGGHLASFL